MAELIIPESCGLVTSTWLFAGKSNPITTTMGINDFGTGDPQTDIEEVYEGWVTAGGFCAAANMSPNYTFTGCSMIYNNAGIMEGYESTGPAVVGTSAQMAQMIVGNSLLVQKRTGRVGRHFRGRGYWPITLISEGDISAMGQIASTPLADLTDQVETTTAAWLAATDWRPVLLHSDTVVTPGYTAITSWQLQSKVATQRRRLRS